MEATNGRQELPIPKNIHEAIETFLSPGRSRFERLSDVLASGELSRFYDDAIGSSEAALEYPVQHDGRDWSLAKGTLLMFLLHRIVSSRSSDKSSTIIDSIIRKDEFRAAVIAFHQLPNSLELQFLEFCAAGTTSIILKVRAVGHGKCALKLIQPQYSRMASIRAATKSYAPNQRNVGSNFSPEVHLSDWTWILMDFVEGKNLAEHMNTIRHYPFASDAYIKEVTTILGKLTQALSFYETKRPPIVHGDLNPYNIMVELGEHDSISIKLIDFGPNYVLRERIGSRHSFADIFSRTKLFTAPEVLDGYEPTIEADLFSLGMIALELLSPEALKQEDIGKRLEVIWENSLTIGVAQIIEDLIDPKPERRMLIIEAQHRIGRYAEINNFLQEQIQLYRELKTQGTSEWPSLLAKCTGFALKDTLLDLQRIKNVSVAWYSTVTSKELMYAWLNVILFALCVIFFWIYTVADLYVYFNPGKTAANSGVVAGFEGIRRDFDLFGIPFKTFTLGNFLENLPGRLVAISFAYVAATYYGNIFASLRVSGMGDAAQRIANSSLRANAFFYFPPIFVAIIWNPLWWPACAVFGMSASVLNNYICWSVVRRTLDQSFGLSSYSATDPKVFLKRFKEWAVQMALYSVLIAGIGALLWFDLASDQWVYGYIVVGINVLKIARMNCWRDAPAVLGYLSKYFFLARRIDAFQKKQLSSAL